MNENSQQIAMNEYDSAPHIGEALAEYTDVKQEGDELFSHHIDHFQILPAGRFYLLFVLYRKVRIQSQKKEG